MAMRAIPGTGRLTPHPEVRAAALKTPRTGTNKRTNNSTSKIFISLDPLIQKIKRFFSLSDEAIDREIQEAKNPKNPKDIEQNLKTPEGIQNEINYNPYSPVKTALHSSVMLIAIQEQAIETLNFFEWLKRLIAEKFTKKNKAVPKQLMLRFEEAQVEVKKAKDIMGKLKEIETRLHQVMDRIFNQISELKISSKKILKKLNLPADDQAIGHSLYDMVKTYMQAKILEEKAKTTRLTPQEEHQIKSAPFLSVTRFDGRPETEGVDTQHIILPSQRKKIEKSLLEEKLLGEGGRIPSIAEVITQTLNQTNQDLVLRQISFFAS